MMRGTTRGTAGGLAVIAILAVGTSLLVSWKMHGEEGHLRGLLTAEIDRGSLVGLGRAQAIGRRVVLSDPDDAEAAALLAYAGALLATEFGQATINEAESAATRAEQAGAARGSPAAVIAGSARALVALRRGDAPRALELATAAAAAASDGPHARCALGRVRAATGDLPGASHALEAAMVEAPGFLPAKVAWAEVRLDLGDAGAARSVLEPIVARAPEDLRARLMLEEASQALAADPRLAGAGAARGPASAALEAACGQNGVLKPYVVAGCALAWASRARFAGERLRASTQSQAAARVLPDEPRMLARGAQLLAQEGFVEKADKLLERASRFAAPQTPELAWARLAVTLGHGRAATAPPGTHPFNATTRVIAARAAFAAGGAGALAAVLDGYGAAVVALDADLRLLATLTAPPAAPAVAQASPPPSPDAAAVAAPHVRESAAQHYVDGLRARLAGDALLAAEHLSHALTGHADACRAAGEYVATLRALKRHPDAAAFNTLRADNPGCVNLPAP
jgi:tetratricopeptide (TPR) repeat protein